MISIDARFLAAMLFFAVALVLSAMNAIFLAWFAFCVGLTQAFACGRMLKVDDKDGK